MRKFTLPLLFVLVALPALALGQPASEFKPDPAKVLRWGKGYRYPQAGWIVLHIEGEPYERGYQHGRLMASEIAAYCHCFAQQFNYKAPAEGWKGVRMFTNAVFLRKFDKEYLEEMKGIADGATAAGARLYNRPIDIVDIAAINAWAEIESLDEANSATPNGLESKVFPDPQAQPKPKPRSEHCSAFAATGPATADGKIVFGHITMWSLYPANFYNVWLDVQPSQGHRVVMCAFPGAIQSGLDYYMNSAGLLVSETTISQTRFDINGMTAASRIRKVMQYASNIDKAVEILLKDNNGLYTNEWLLADINTNEIAMFELGTHKHKLWRSSKNEWFGDTPGFYWGCNNVKDVDVTLETIPSVQGKPASVVFKPGRRDIEWQKFYEKYKGKIGVEFGKAAFSSPIIAMDNSSLDAKFTTTALAKEMKSWALFGPPTGKTWNPSAEDKRKFPEVKALVSNPWTVLGTMAPPAGSGQEAPMIATAKAKTMGKGKKAADDDEDGVHMPPAWRGTLLPQSDGDVWLAIAFADYERAVAVEQAALKNGETPIAASKKLDAAIAEFRRTYQAASKKGDTALANIKSSTTTDTWYRLAQSKGVLLLHALRTEVGAKTFDKAMDDFGMAQGGQRVSSQQFQAHFEKAAARKLDGFFEEWLKGKGLPKAEAEAPQWSAWGALRRTGLKVDGQILYLLENERGIALEHAISAQGMVLEPHVGRKMCLYGPVAVENNLAIHIRTVSLVSITD